MRVARRGVLKGLSVLLRTVTTNTVALDSRIAHTTGSDTDRSLSFYPPIKMIHGARKATLAASERKGRSVTASYLVFWGTILWSRCPTPAEDSAENKHTPNPSGGSCSNSSNSNSRGGDKKRKHPSPEEAWSDGCSQESKESAEGKQRGVPEKGIRVRKAAARLLEKPERTTVRVVRKDLPGGASSSTTAAARLVTRKRIKRRATTLSRPRRQTPRMKPSEAPVKKPHHKESHIQKS